jgi:hypothetical protein
MLTKSWTFKTRAGDEYYIEPTGRTYCAGQDGPRYQEFTGTVKRAGAAQSWALPRFAAPARATRFDVEQRALS